MSEEKETILVKTEIPKPLHKALKIRSAKKGLYQKIIIKKAIKQYLTEKGEYKPEKEQK